LSIRKCYELLSVANAARRFSRVARGQLDYYRLWGGRCPLDPLQYGFLFSVRLIRIDNVAYDVPALWSALCPVSDFKKSVLASRWLRFWICWALSRRRGRGTKFAVLVQCIALPRREVDASRPTSRGESTAAFVAARQAITWTCTPLRLTRASLLQRWSCATGFAVTCRGSTATDRHPGLATARDQVRI
jgi:hypothetical protein